MVNYSIMPSIGQVAILATSLMGLAESHMFMAEPKPLEGYASKDPLDKSGSNFACKGADLSQYTSGGQKLTAGESFPFKLELGGGANTAVHGGGSCQISLFYGSDSEKAKDPKNWQVIYSIEGGCPANTKGNLGEQGAVACKDDKEGDCVHSWDIPMPKGVKSGNAILSWTWFNTVGNREMYQNCASVDIQGGSGDEMNSFPPLFVANLASVDSQCQTEEDSDVLFPSPGKYVTTMSATNGFNHPKATPAGCGGSGGAAPSGYSGPSATSAPAYTSAPAAPSTPAASSAPAAPSAGIQNSYTNQKGRQTATTFATMSAPAASSAAPAPTGAASDSASGASSGSSYGSGSNSTGGSTGQCSEDGALVCNGPSKFGICDHGSVVWQDVAAGTQCLNGAIAAKSRFARRHAGHFGGAHKH